MTDLYSILDQHSPAEILSVFSSALKVASSQIRASDQYRSGLLNVIGALKDNRPDDALRYAEEYLSKGKQVENEKA